jgi:undecaprenyl-phosphate 4-deoxy-4-formamido-L-arabinose transferase
MDLSVVVPVYNSEKIIDDLVKKINDSINNIKSINSYEIILISDCSPDRSWRK